MFFCFFLFIIPHTYKQKPPPQQICFRKHLLFISALLSKIDSLLSDPNHLTLAEERKLVQLKKPEHCGMAPVTAVWQVHRNSSKIARQSGGTFVAILPPPPTDSISPKKQSRRRPVVCTYTYVPSLNLSPQPDVTSFDAPFQHLSSPPPPPTRSHSSWLRGLCPGFPRLRLNVQRV